ncbi:MAG: hypothetical protein IJY61_02590 [Candidatus Gastranaerophilales bacterium]|nr:hypothetical protein [Candidatus Gastranaerophilales bacterium]
MAAIICSSSLNVQAIDSYTLTNTTTPANNTITKYSVDKSTGAITEEYYQLGLKTTSYGSGSTTKTKTVTIPTNQNVNITFKHGTSKTRQTNPTGTITGSFVNLSGYASGDAINSTTTTKSINANFYGNNGTSNGGAIYFSDAAEVTNGIIGNFIGNYVATTSIATGGAITAQNVTGNLGNIQGDFIANYVNGTAGASGGAIQIAGGYYNGSTSIIGNFIGNYVNSANANACGGAIDYYGYLNNITADFIGNRAISASSSKEAYGGAIFSFGGKVKDITGDFIGNYAKNTGGANAHGGAIDFRFQVTETGKISGDFIGNYVQSVADSFGGVLYNYGGNIGTITGNYNGNYAKASKKAYGGAIANQYYGTSVENKINAVGGEFVGNYATGGTGAYGGAIYNNAATMNIVNASFYGNHADSTSGKALGGAIYNTGDISALTITADNYSSEFVGNYTNLNGTKSNNAIYTTSAITMQAKNNGSILLSDKIDGTSGYGLTFTGDGTGTIYLNNTLGAPKITANNITLDMQNDSYQAYAWNTLSANKTAKFEIDSDFHNSKTDTIRITNAPSSQSYVNISSLGFAENPTFTSEDLNKKLQIINAPSNKLQLALTDSVTKETYKYGQDTRLSNDIRAEVSSDEIFYNIYDTYDLYGNIALATTNTTNDSITFIANSSLDTLVGTEKIAYADTLAALNTWEDTSSEKVFTIVSEEYVANENLGATLGELTIQSRILNLNGKTGFELSNAATINLKDVKLTGNETLANVSNTDAVINLNNAYLDGNMTASQVYDMSILGTKNTINGTLQNTNATLSSGEFVFNPATFKSNGNTLTVQNGSLVNLVDNVANNYTIDKLVSTNGKYHLDFNVTENKIDTITVGDKSTGTVTLLPFNFVGDIPSDGFKKQILFASNNAIQLALDETMTQGDPYVLGTTTRYIDDLVTSTVDFDHVFKTYSEEGITRGYVQLATTNTTNDSILLEADPKYTLWSGNLLYYADMGDTLALLNTTTGITEAKNFNFKTATDTYTASDNLGATFGVLNLNGYTSRIDKSIINLNGKTGFELSNAATINLKDVKLTGNETLANVSNTDAVINLNNAYLDGNITASQVYDMGILGTKNTINGTLQNTNATLSSGEFVFNPATFKSNGNTLTVVAGNVNMVTNSYENYEINKLVSNGGTYSIDLNVDTGEVDTITVGSGSTGTVTLGEFNMLGSNPPKGEFEPIQILKAPTGSSIQLALSEAVNTGAPYKLGTTQRMHYDEIISVVDYDTEYSIYSELGDTYGNIELTTTNTQNDSIVLNVNDELTKWSGNKEYYGSQGDTLVLLSQKETTDKRLFNFKSSKDEYILSDDLKNITAGSLTVKGVSEGTDKSVLNLNSKTGFELRNETTLNITDVKLMGNEILVNVLNNGAVINLANSYIDGNITGSLNYDVNINGLGLTTLNGTLKNSNTTLSSGSLVFNTDTFESATLDVQSGNVLLADGKTKSYTIDTLISDNSAKYAVDVNVKNATADKFYIGSSSSGVVYVDSLQLSDVVEKEFTVQLLSGSKNISLQLNENLTNTDYSLGKAIDVTSNITSTVKFDDVFEESVTEGQTYGKLQLATTTTKDDSIALKYEKTIWGETVTTQINDTLAYLNKFETTDDKNFNFTSSADVYTVKENLGSTSSGILNINGVAGSKIDANGKDLFVLDNETTLNLNNVSISGANSIATGSNQNAVLNIKESTLMNNSTGIKTAATVNVIGNSTIVDNITGVENDGSTPILNIKDGNILLGGTVTNFETNILNSNLILLNDNILNGLDVLFDGTSSLNVANGVTSTVDLSSLTLANSINMAVDVDLANSSMDRIVAGMYDVGSNTININKMNLLSDTKQVKTEILFADEGLRNNVSTSVKQVSYSPLYKYLVEYQQENGSFIFTKGGGATPGSFDSFSPSVVASPIAAQMGGYLVMLNSYDEAFRNMDMYMLMTKKQREAIKHANKYAASDSHLVYTEVNTPYTESSGWFRPYATFETVGLKNGPKVNNVAYGSSAGLESEMYDLGYGWDGIYSVYAAYNGSHQTYKGNGIYQNGGTLGLVGMAYKGNFFTGLTANVGASVGEASMLDGTDDFTMLMSGIASKTGYNFEFADGKFIVQPNYLMSYSMINTFDYTTSSGAKISSDPLHAIQIEPGVKFIGNLSNGWQPYAGVSVVMNAMDKTQFRANDVSLPSLSVKPFVKYGVGVRKTCGERIVGFLQSFVTSGGRNGVGIQAGFRITLGKDK